MSDFKTWRRFLRGWRLLTVVIFSFVIASTAIRLIVPAHEAVRLAGQPRAAVDTVLLVDKSWLDESDERRLSQQLFDQILANIGQATDLILLDMFLFNDWQGPVPESHRSLSAELTDALIERKQTHPDVDIIVVSDPINTVYNGLASAHFDRLVAANILLSLTDLTRLQDSNPAWSGIWRWLIRPFGNSEASTLPNPFGLGRVSIRSYLALLNFKANHRKLLISDDGFGQWRALISSANPHDGSSAHRNVALQFGGYAVMDLMAMERALLAMNRSTVAVSVLDKHMAEFPVSVAIQSVLPSTLPTLQVINESRIHDAILTALQSAEQGDAIDLAMFYLSERQIIHSLKRAQERGAIIRVLLDVNSDAFGRQKNGVPNLPVAAELVKAGVSVRWCATDGEQCHAKWLHVSATEKHTFILGSANFTRRNLLDFNLETDVLLTTQADDVITRKMTDFFDEQWNNTSTRTYSVAYDKFAQDSWWLTLQYRFMEATGLSTF